MDASNRATTGDRLGAIACLTVAIVGTLAVGTALSRGGGDDVRIAELPIATRCEFPTQHPAAALGMFAADTHWVAMVVLEGVAAAFALMCAVATILAIRRLTAHRRDMMLAMLLVIGVGIIAWDVREVWTMATHLPPRGFLSQLLSSLPAGCRGVARSVVWARMIGEPTGICLGVAMIATVMLVDRPAASDLATRIRHLRRLLYVASVLFVAGILMSRANFRWVTAHWDIIDEAQLKALAAVIEAGVVQSGVGYSALLALFFVPARMLLHAHVGRVSAEANMTTAKERQSWLEDNDLAIRWQEDARQIFAILAPVLSIPVFDAIAKL